MQEKENTPKPTSSSSLLWNEELWRLMRNLAPSERVEFINAVLNFYFQRKTPHLTGTLAYAFAVARESIEANRKASELQGKILRVIVRTRHAEEISDGETSEIEEQKKLACDGAREALKRARERDRLREEISAEINEIEQLFSENPALANEWGWKPPEER